MTSQEMIEQACGTKVINVQANFGHTVVFDSIDDARKSFSTGIDISDFEPILLSDYLRLSTFMSYSCWTKALRKYLPTDASEILLAWAEE